MERRDLRCNIEPHTIENTDENQEMGNKKFNTTDLIYLDSYHEYYDNKRTDKERRISATDYAKMNNAYTFDGYTTCTGRRTTCAWLRSAYSSYYGYCVHGVGDWRPALPSNRDLGLSPSLHYHLPSNISARSALRILKGKKNRDESKKLEQFDIREVKDLDRKNYMSYITYWRVYWNKSQRRFE